MTDRDQQPASWRLARVTRHALRLSAGRAPVPYRQPWYIRWNRLTGSKLLATDATRLHARVQRLAPTIALLLCLPAWGQVNFFARLDNMIAVAQDHGQIPAWVDSLDHFRIVLAPGNQRAALCIRDNDTAERWVSVGPAARAWNMVAGDWQAWAAALQDTTPTTPEDVALCHSRF